MLVSIVIPAFNAEKYLPETLDSALMQTHRDLEVVVVDDGSTDNTAALVRACPDERVRLVQKANGGLSSARNAGTAVAKGDAIAYLDADDLYDPTHVERQLEVLARPNVVAVGTYMRYVAAESGRAFGLSGETTSGRQDDIRAARLMPFPISSTLFDATTARDAGPFDESLPQVEDLDFLARVAALGVVEVIPEPLGGYRAHESSMTATGHGEQRLITRFVQARVAARQSGQPEPTLEDFRRDFRYTWNDRRRDAGAIYFRSAGLAVVNGHKPRGALLMLRASVFAPIRTARRLALRLRS